MPRSMRVICDRPQLCAMSVAFDAHGDTVPKRGVTKNRFRPSESCGAATLCASIKASSFAASSAAKGASDAAKYQNSLDN